MSLVALQTSDVTVAWTRDLWQLGGGQVETVRYRKGLTILEALARAIPADVLRQFSGSDCIVTLNGEARGRDLWGMPLFAGDHLTWRPSMSFPAAPVVAGAGAGGLFGGAAAGAAAGGGFFTGFLTLLGVSLLGTAASVAVQMLLAPTPPRKQRGDESSPTSSWRGVQVSFGAGQPIPTGFGQHMIAGQVIQAFRRSTSLASTNQPLAVGTDTLYLLVSLGYGPHHDLGGFFPPGGEDQFDEEPASIFPAGSVLIDDQPLNTDTYPNARFWWRNGQELQTPIPGFSNLRTEYPLGLEFRVPPTPQQTRLTAVPFNLLFWHVYVLSTEGFFPLDQAIFDPGGANVTRDINYVSPPTGVTAIIQTGVLAGTFVEIEVDTISGISIDEAVEVGAGLPNAENAEVFAFLSAPTRIVVRQLANNHSAGEPVIRWPQMTTGGPFSGVPGNAIVQRVGRPGQRSIFYKSTADSTQLSNQSVDPGIVVRIEMDACYRLNGANFTTFQVQFRVSERLEGSSPWSNPRDYFLVDKKTEPFPVDLVYAPTLRQDGKKLELRIERITPVDNTPTSQTNTVTNSQVASVLESITTTYTTGGPNPVTRTDEHRYPFHALVAMRLPAIEQFSGSRPPTIKFKTKLLWCPDVTFTGTYNFIPWQSISNRVNRWTNNPARCCMAALTDELWGVGDVYTSAQLNLREFYRWKVYCGQTVSDGQGGTRERFNFDANFDELQSRQDALGAICAAGRCVLVEVGGLVTPIFAHPDDPGAGLPLPITGVYTETNIIGFIRRQYLPVNNPPDVINCEYQNAARNYDRDLQPVRDPKARRRPYRLRGINNKPETLNLVGCTSTAQAVSEGRYRHNVLRLIEHRYEFVVGRDTVQSVPGQRIATSHSAFNWFGEGTVLTNVARNSGPSYPPDDELRIVDARNFAVGDRIQVDPPGVAENYEVQSIDLVANVLTLTSPLLTDHTAASAHKVVNLGLGANGAVNATCGSGDPDPAVLRTTDIYGIRPGDEVWINPGGPRDERHWVEEVVGPGEYRLRNAMGFAHTAVQGDLVRSLSFATYTGRSPDAGTATDSIAIDQPVDVPSTPGFTAIAVRQKDGTVKQARITDPPGTYAAGFVFTAPGLASTHNADAPVALGIETRMLQEMRLAEVRQNPDLTFTLVAVDYNEEVFDDSPDGFVEPAPDAGAPGYGADSIDSVDAVTSLLAVQRPSTVPDGTGAVDVSWSKTSERAAGSVVVWYREQGGQNTTWRRAGSSKTGRLVIDNLDQGRTYEVTAVPESSDQLGFVEPAAGAISIVTIYERGARRIGGV